MKRKLQVILTEESWASLDSLTKEANDGFTTGSINMSDIVNEVLQTAKLDVRGLQAKHVNIRRSLRQMASQKDIDIDAAIKSLMEMKASSKRPAKQQTFLKGVDA
jgi:hypothetical protein